jgi:hypothetical protein
MKVNLAVWKYPIVHFSGTNVEMPVGAKILTAQHQDGVMTLWALGNPAAERERREFRIFGTGWPIEQDNLSYVATAQEGMFVWHLFEVLSPSQQLRQSIEAFL